QRPRSPVWAPPPPPLWLPDDCEPPPEFEPLPGPPVFPFPPIPPVMFVVSEPAAHPHAATAAMRTPTRATPSQRLRRLLAILSFSANSPELSAKKCLTRADASQHQRKIPRCTFYG